MLHLHLHFLFLLFSFDTSKHSIFMNFLPRFNYMFLSCRDEREEGNSYIISFLHPGGPFIMGYPMPSLAGLAGPFLPWGEREGIVRIGLRLHHSFCLSESNPYNPFSFPSPLVPRGSSFIMWRDREALRCFSARGASAGVHYPFAPRHRRGGDHEVETAGGRY